MPLPNYTNGSIVNLMSSILHALGGSSPYRPLRALPPGRLSGCQNIVLLILDGLGYDYLAARPGSLLGERLQGRMTSVFPSTTAACVTTFATGLAPQQHAVTGWFMHLKELGTVSAILPFKPRYGGSPFDRHKIDISRILNTPTPVDQVQARHYALIPHDLVNSAYNLATKGQARLKPHRSFRQCLKAIEKIIHSGRSQKYIYAYWPEFDTLSHKHGNNSQAVTLHFQLLEQKLKLFLESVTTTDTIMIITADHGFVDTPPDRVIKLTDHPRLAETLTLPLCGEERLAYCYVRPARANQFEQYVAEHLAHCCTCYRSQQLIDDHYFGLFDPHPRLSDRVGDYILVMKENYVIQDRLLGENRDPHIGHHGGVSRAEMFVPLITIDM